MTDDENEDDEETRFEPEPLEAIGPDGRTYRIVAVPRGESLNPGESTNTDLWGVAIDIVWAIGVAANASRLRGWKIGVISPRSPLFGGGVKHKEFVENEESVEPRMREVADLVALRGPNLS